MKNKGRFLLSFLEYDWWKILCSSLLVSFIIGLSFNYKDALRDDQILEIFVSASNKNISYQEELLNSVPNDKIKGVQTNAYPTDYLQFNALSSSLVSRSADLFILSEDVLKKNNEYLSYALPLEEEERTKILSVDENLSFYKVEETRYFGIKIFDKSDSSFNEHFAFSSYFNFLETSYYLFVSKVSTNKNDKDNKGNNLLLEYACSWLNIALKK